MAPILIIMIKVELPKQDTSNSKRSNDSVRSCTTRSNVLMTIDKPPNCLWRKAKRYFWLKFDSKTEEQNY